MFGTFQYISTMTPVAGRGGMRRASQVQDKLQGISDAAIRRLARRGGVKRISHGIYEETRRVIKNFLEWVIRDATVYTDRLATREERR